MSDKPTVREAIEAARSDLDKFDHPVASVHIERRHALVLINAASRTQQAEAALDALVEYVKELKSQLAAAEQRAGQAKSRVQP